MFLGIISVLRDARSLKRHNLQIESNDFCNGIFFLLVLFITVISFDVSF